MLSSAIARYDDSSFVTDSPSLEFICEQDNIQRLGMNVGDFNRRATRLGVDAVVIALYGRLGASRVIKAPLY